MPGWRFAAWCFGVCALIIAAGTSMPARQAAPADEIRGLWVLRTSLDSAKDIDAAVRTAEASGFNTLLVQVRGRGEAYYQSAIEPRASDLDAQPSSFDPLATMIGAAHRAGLRVHAWVNIDLISSAATLPRSREHVVSRHPEWLMVPKPLAADLHGVDVRSPAYVGQLARWTRNASATIEGLYLSPIPKASQDYTAGVIEELVARYPVDGVHFDYARYPSEQFDYSAAALEEFRAAKTQQVTAAERRRLDQNALVDPAAWANMFPEGWAAFRRDRLTGLVQRLSATARAARPGITVSAAVAPDARSARDRLFQDWSSWAATKVLDVVCPMAYTPNLSEFSEMIARARSAAGSAPVWAGIGAWQMPASRTAEHVRAARRANVAGVLLFSYDALTAGETKTANYFADLRQALLGTNPD